MECTVYAAVADKAYFPASSPLVQAGSSLSPVRPFFLLPLLPQGPRGELGVTPKYIWALEPSNLSIATLLPPELGRGGELRPPHCEDPGQLSTPVSRPAASPQPGAPLQEGEPKPPSPLRGPGKGPLLPLHSASGIHGGQAPVEETPRSLGGKGGESETLGGRKWVLLSASFSRTHPPPGLSGARGLVSPRGAVASPPP